MSAGQVGDCFGAAVLLGGQPEAGWLLSGRGYEALLR